MRGRDTEVYGFVSWILSRISFCLYLLWAVVPDHRIVNTLGFSYFPSKYWAIAFPQFIFVTFLFAVVAYWALSLTNTPALSSYTLVADTRQPTADCWGGGGRGGGGESTVKVESSTFTVPLHRINELLYSS
eukprot:GHVU01137295.1.p1 GENE.GHVU01137295.1~~GHVU01137295.1.p1  ORF type:complete len:131 (-),score=17.36 GHVU01137295.1:296-688(-)